MSRTRDTFGKQKRGGEGRLCGVFDVWLDWLISKCTVSSRGPGLY